MNKIPLIPKLTRAAEKPILRPREFWGEQIYEWADGEIGYAVLVLGCCDAQHAANEVAEYCEHQAAEYCKEHLIRVTDHRDVVSQWDVEGETTLVYRARERIAEAPAPNAD